MARVGLYPDAPKIPCVVGYEVSGTIDQVGDGRHRLPRRRSRDGDADVRRIHGHARRSRPSRSSACRRSMSVRGSRGAAGRLPHGVQHDALHRDAAPRLERPHSLGGRRRRARRDPDREDARLHHLRHWRRPPSTTSCGARACSTRSIRGGTTRPPCAPSSAIAASISSSIPSAASPGRSATTCSAPCGRLVAFGLSSATAGTRRSLLHAAAQVLQGEEAQPHEAHGRQQDRGRHEHGPPVPPARSAQASVRGAARDVRGAARSTRASTAPFASMRPPRRTSTSTTVARSARCCSSPEERHDNAVELVKAAAALRCGATIRVMGTTTQVHPRPMRLPVALSALFVAMTGALLADRVRATVRHDRRRDHGDPLRCERGAVPVPSAAVVPAERRGWTLIGARARSWRSPAVAVLAVPLSRWPMDRAVRDRARRQRAGHGRAVDLALAPRSTGADGSRTSSGASSSWAPCCSSCGSRGRGRPAARGDVLIARHAARLRELRRARGRNGSLPREPVPTQSARAARVDPRGRRLDRLRHRAAPVVRHRAGDLGPAPRGADDRAARIHPRRVVPAARRALRPR